MINNIRSRGPRTKTSWSRTEKNFQISDRTRTNKILKISDRSPAVSGSLIKLIFSRLENSVMNNAAENRKSSRMNNWYLNGTPVSVKTWNQSMVMIRLNSVNFSDSIWFWAWKPWKSQGWIPRDSWSFKIRNQLMIMIRLENGHFRWKSYLIFRVNFLRFNLIMIFMIFV